MTSYEDNTMLGQRKEDARKSYRHEYKYLLNAADEAVLKMRAEGLLSPDPHVGRDGKYIVRSLYFDDWDDRCYYENEAGEDRREKYRIRIYDLNDRYITLEKKSKLRGMTNKTSCPITLEQCNVFMKGGIPDADRKIPGQQALLYEMRVKVLRPAVIVQYVRTPYIYQAGNVRVTFDSCIASGGAVDSFFDENAQTRQILEKGRSILEVKWDAFLPDHIKQVLELDTLQWTSFSKYYLCRKYNDRGGLRS